MTKPIEKEMLFFRAAAVAAGATNMLVDSLLAAGTLDEWFAHPRAPLWAVWLACHVVRGRWPDAEPVIAREPWTSLRYARCVVKGRWEQGEAAIGKNARASKEYVKMLAGTSDA